MQILNTHVRNYVNEPANYAGGRFALQACLSVKRSGARVGPPLRQDGEVAGRHQIGPSGGTHILMYPLHLSPPFAPPSLRPVLELCVVQHDPPLFDTTRSGVPTQVMTARPVNDRGEPFIPILIRHTLP